MQKNHANHNHPEETPHNCSAKSHSETHHEGMHHGHGSMVKDFQRRFWVSLTLTVPVLLLSPMIQEFLEIPGMFFFRGDVYVFMCGEFKVFKA